MSSIASLPLGIDDVRQAAARTGEVAHRTPVMTSAAIDDLTGATVYMKLENLQRTGSFKIRGAYNKISHLSEAGQRAGVVAASAGNHAQGVALAASLLGLSSTIVMPTTAPISKVEATRSYGAEIVLKGTTFDAAFSHAKQLAEQQGLTLIHAFNDPLIIAGQGTVGLELLEELPDLDAVVVPIGGGGLISGIALAVKSLRPDIRVYGVEPEGAAAMVASLKSGRLTPAAEVNTIADGLAVKHPGELTFQLASALVDDVVTVNEDQIARAILTYLEKAKIMVEGAGAAGLAALLSGQLDLRGQRVALVTSGGNIDVNLLSRIIERGLIESSRYLHFRVTLVDHPGALRDLLGIVAGCDCNVLQIDHDRLDHHVALGQAEAVLLVETKGQVQVEQLKSALHEAGYDFEMIN